MTANFNDSLSDKEKNILIDALTDELVFLRSKAGLSQDELANLIGVSRQTYGSLERKLRKMSWNTYLSLIMFYDYNKKTHKLLRSLPAFPNKFIKSFNEDNSELETGLSSLFNPNIQSILDSLDPQARNNIRTMLMIEYSRCKGLSSEAVIKFFEGIDIFPTFEEPGQIETAKALQNIRRKRSRK